MKLYLPMGNELPFVELWLLLWALFLSAGVFALIHACCEFGRWWRERDAADDETGLYAAADANDASQPRLFWMATPIAVVIAFAVVIAPWGHNCDDWPWWFALMMGCIGW